MFDDKDFDRHFNTTRRIAIAGTITGFFVSLAVLGFACWVVVKLLAHFGVI